MRLPLPSWLRTTSIRTKLIATFLLLFAITLAVVLVGVLGMRANQRALDDYEAKVVPEIARVLELSEKVAQMAAVAPGMAVAESPYLLRDDTSVLQGLLGDIRRLSINLTATAGEKLSVSDELDGIDQDLTRLLMLSGRQRELKAELDALRRENDQIGERIYRQRVAVAQGTPTLLNVWAVTSTALEAEDDAALGLSESNSEALWLQVQARGEQRRQPGLAESLRRVDTGPRSVFAVRREFLANEQRIGYLVTLFRGHSDHLGFKASRYVEELRQVARQRREAVRQVALSSQSGLLLLAMAGVGLALAGVTYVGHILRKLQTMTRVMTRLASGDTSHRIPSTDRPDEVGDLARAFEVFRTNLLEKQQLALGLDEQRRLLRTVFHSMNDGVSVHDQQGRLIVWNPTFASLLGLPDAAIHTGMTLAELRHAVPQPARWRAVSRQTATRTGNTRIAASAELHLADQHILEFHCQGMPEGGWVAVCRDLTSRRAVEAELRQAQKMDVLGQLTGGVAHDFNNFLVAILGNLELLEPRLQDQPDSQVMAERARRAAERASRLTRRLLAFARRQPLQAEQVSVEEMLAEMLDLVEYAAGPKIAVVLAPLAQELWINVDRGQLENAILNLSLNSAAAMPDGGTLTLAVQAVAAPTPLPGAVPAVVLSVSDTGSGIPPMLIDKVMEPFFTTKAPGEGSGLGLSSVYGFVRQSGGDMQIHSAVGQGTQVELWLPAVAQPALTLAPPAADNRPPRPPPGARVLVVEDDPEVLDTTLSQLAALGVEAHGVSTSAAALDWLGQHDAITLVLSDISLGAGGNGITLAAQIRQRWPMLRVVLTSGLPQEVHQAHPNWLPEQAFLAKPFNLEDLSALLA
jgi:PAS domain S-box-containing protein